MIYYTDGSCVGNGKAVNSGGFGIVILNDDGSFSDSYAKRNENILVINQKNQGVSAARNAGVSGNTAERLEQENQISGALRQIFALAENYPDLKANTNFLDLQAQLKKIEEDIANSRKYYNAVVKNYNDKCMTIPSNIVAGIGHFEKETMFEAVAAERENVKVEF